MIAKEKKDIENNETKEVIKKVFNYYRKEYSKLTDDWRSLPYDALSSIREKERIRLLEKDIKTKLKGKKVLNVGSGIGSFDIEMQRYGADMHGVEPDPLEYEIAVERINNKNLKQNIEKAVGEGLPYPDSTFDVVTSFQVMEHVRDPGKVIKEMVRVTKKNGIIYINMPNHNSFWEGHYGCFWLPHFPKPLAKLYVRYIRGKDPDFLDTINYLSPGKVRRQMKKHKVLDKVKILGWGSELFEERLEKLNFTAWGHTGKLKNIVKIVKKLGMIGLLKWINRNVYGFYYPMILIMRKR
ncbi:MAG TPA: class I SAM-dependent methyltransferase [Candidatus Nanoarchaeia archaeon]|nr:class I SAM-dependent methyltransferase [Candidatus Nanoarchaeia archaeon]